MPTEQIIALVLIGLIAGILAGMFGIGGGVVIVPALIALLGFSIYAATGTSLAALLLPVGIFAVIEYYRAGHLDIKIAAIVAFGLLFGSYFGSRIALGLDSTTLQRIYGVFLMYVAWRFIEPHKWLAERRGEKLPAKSSETPDARWYVVLLLGLVAGVLAGMFGIGGGVVIVPALVEILGFDQKRAVGTSLAALLLPVSLPAVIVYYNEGILDLRVAAFVAGGLLFGALAGARIALGLSSTTIKRLYGIFLVFVAIRFIFPELFLG